MNATLDTNVDFSALFGIEFADTAEVPQTKTSNIVCQKCHGRGKFVSYTGRVVGNCFTCAGTGLSRTVGVAIKEGDCTKCAGSGEYSPGRQCFACEGTGKLEKKVAADISVKAIEQAFGSAMANGIKRPKLRLDTFVFSRAPDTGKNAGALYVKEGENYLGKITEGQFHPTRSCDNPAKDRIVAAAANPHDSAKAYGMKTGSCGCCGRELTNGESIALGIGPICRDKFGW